MSSIASSVFVSDFITTFYKESANYPAEMLTRESLLDGSCVIDSRNFANPSTCRLASRAGLITKFGSRMQTVQYWMLTEKGFDTLFPESR